MEQAMTLTPQTIDILDSHIAYSQTGAGDTTIVFLHGNPTSSHLWRNVIPHVAGHARVLAPDLIGMGASGKPGIPYRFADHARYLDAWFDALDLRDVVLVGHDWGGALAMDWAARHPDRVRAVALVETFLRPMTWAEYPAAAVDLFKTLRTPGAGEKMALDENWFIETALRATNPGISDDDLAVYRRPFPDPVTRRPLLQFPREIPLDGEPADVRDRFLAYDQWLADTPAVPKLLMVTEPGGLVSPVIEQWARDSIAALEVESIGQAGHHAPEDQPDAIGKAIASWLERHPA
jgi:haloalkane dehalogenase